MKRLKSEGTRNLTLDEKIKGLDEQSLSRDTIRGYKSVFAFSGHDPHRDVKRYDHIGRLLDFKSIRNDTAHSIDLDYISKKQQLVEELMVYVWNELSPEQFKSAYERATDRSPAGIIGRLFETTADYMTRAVDETMIRQKPEPFKGISADDFENMFNLRKKMASLQAELKAWLAIKAASFQTDVLTTIDTTSAYIWMPLVRKRDDLGDIRLGIRGVSVSILATPLDFRVYLEFGGWAKDERKAFYRFLKSSEYEDFYKEIGSKTDLMVFDVDWYSARFNERLCSTWLEGREQSIQDALAKLEKAGDSPVTWNRMLHGYLITRASLGDDGAITMDLLSPKLLNIIVLYEVFAAFATRKKEQKNATK
ncbi:MAG: hypothetical protein PHN92_11790 [Geobacter sp.]|nr:hypothetical protein [Geobacter sp.]